MVLPVTRYGCDGLEHYVLYHDGTVRPHMPNIGGEVPSFRTLDDWRRGRDEHRCSNDENGFAVLPETNVLAKGADSRTDAERGFDDYFGACPHCRKHDSCINIGRGHWYSCKEHKVKWCVGANLFRGWRDQTEDEQRKIYDNLGFGKFQKVEPYTISISE